MTRKEECFLSYIAGIIDGEGSIFIRRQIRKNRPNKGYSLVVGVQMTDWIVPILLHQKYGGCLTMKQFDTKRKHPVLEWRIWDNIAYEFLLEIKEYLIVKHDLAKMAIGFQVYRRKSKRASNSKYGFQPYSPETYIKFDKYYQRQSARNHNPNNGMKTVELLKKLSLRKYCAKREDYERLLEGATTRVNKYKPISVPEQDIV